MKFSLLISIYEKDKASYFYEALNSILNNTIHPNEIILVCDGKLTKELESVIEKFKFLLPMNIVRLDTNQGLGVALNIGLKYCTYEWVARFDADDISLEERFAKQIEFLQKNPHIDICGGQISEFSINIKDTEKRRIVPLNHTQIIQFAKYRNPMNHMTVMFRKSSVLDVGSYQHAPLHEDYDLWVRMLINNYQFANLPDTLVYARAGDSMYRRRGGWSYVKNEINMQKKFYRLGFISLFQLIKNLLVRILPRIVPNKIRGRIYSSFLRKR